MFGQKAPLVPRIRHNDTEEAENDPCATCGHTRKQHAKDPTNDRACQALRYDPMGPSMPCPCQWFVKRRNKPVPKDKPVELSLTWDGEHPKVGEYLMSMHKPKFGYEIVEIVVTRSGKIEITARKALVKDIPAGAKIHALRWNSREPTATRERKGWS